MNAQNLGLQQRVHPPKVSIHSASEEQVIVYAYRHAYVHEHVHWHVRTRVCVHGCLLCQVFFDADEDQDGRLSPFDLELFITMQVAIVVHCCCFQSHSPFDTA